MTRILVDMNLSPGWVGRLGESGIEAIRALDDALRQGAIVTLSAAGSRVRVLPLPGS